MHRANDLVRELTVISKKQLQQAHAKTDEVAIPQHSGLGGLQLETHKTQHGRSLSADSAVPALNDSSIQQDEEYESDERRTNDKYADIMGDSESFLQAKGGLLAESDSSTII